MDEQTAAPAPTKAVAIDPEAHPGAMIALMLSDEQRALITTGVPGRVVREADHCTLVYLADDAAALIAAKPAIVAALAEHAATLPPLSVRLNGYGRFAGDGVEYPLVLLLDAPALDALQAGLADCLTAIGVGQAPRHGFTPHVTLSYLPADAPLPQPDPEVWAGERSLLFGALSLVWAGERIDLPMLGVEETPAEEADEVTTEGRFLTEADIRDYDDAQSDLEADLEADRARLAARFTPDEMATLEQLGLVYAAPAMKSLAAPDPENPYLLRKYFVVWGGRDLVGDTFTRETDLGLSRSLKGMPVYYDHAQRGIKSQVGWIIDDGEDDGDGIVVSIELDRNRRYVADLIAMERAAGLGSSSAAPPHLVQRRSGSIKRWIAAELSLTPTPAEPRTLALKSLPESATEGDPAPQQESPMDDVSTSTAPDSAADVAALRGEITAVRAELTELKSMPAVAKQRDPLKAVEELGGAVGGGMQARASEYDASGRYHYLKSVSRPGAPARTDLYPEGVFGGFVKALFMAQTSISHSRDAMKALKDMYGADPDSPAAKSLGTQAGVSGAFMIPEQFIPMLMQIAAQSDVLYGRTMVIPADGGEIVIPALNHGGSFVAGQSQYFGGVSITWGDDDADPSDTQPNFKQVRLKTNAMKAKTRVKNSLLMRSAITIDSVVSQLLGAAIGRARDYAILRGTGQGQPLGVLNSPATIDVGGSAVDFATLAGMEDNVIPERDENYVWVIHTKKRSSIYSLQQTNNTLVTFLPDLRGKPQAVLLGRNIAWTDKAPFTSGDVSNTVNLIDPSMIVCAEFQGIALAVSDQARFEQDETVFRAICSLDAQPWLTDKIQVTSTPDYVSGFITI